jgi:hypothetical protein
MQYVFAGLVVGVGNVVAFFLESRFGFLEKQLLPALGLGFPGVEVPLIAAALTSALLIGIVGLFMSERAFVVMPIILAAALLSLVAPALGFKAQDFYGVTPIMATIAMFAVIGGFVLMEQGNFLRIEKGRDFVRLKFMVALAAANAGLYYFFTLFSVSPWMGFAIFAASFIFAGLVLGIIADGANARAAQETEWKALAKSVPGLESTIEALEKNVEDWKKARASTLSERDEARSQRDSLKGRLAEKDARIAALEAELQARPAPLKAAA